MRSNSVKASSDKVSAASDTSNLCFSSGILAVFVTQTF